MKLTSKVKKILSYYESDNPGTKASLARMLMHGKLRGTGKLLILPVDQGFEHGPARSFAVNEPAYDPHYHFQMAIDAGLNAFAAPYGLLEAGAATYAGAVPLILKLNSSNSLAAKTLQPDQAITSSVKDALRLGCCAVGVTIYPGSERFGEMLEETREVIYEARRHGLACVVWAYPRGGELEKSMETALDIVAYGAHIAVSLGAHIVKVKLPTDYIAQSSTHPFYEEHFASLSGRVAHIMRCCFSGRRLVVFSGGASKEPSELYREVTAIREGGGNGSIIGRNIFQRSRETALKMLNNIISIYLGKNLNL